MSVSLSLTPLPGRGEEEYSASASRVDYIPFFSTQVKYYSLYAVYIQLTVSNDDRVCFIQSYTSNHNHSWGDPGKDTVFY